MAESTEVTVTVNGRAVTATRGELLIEVAERGGTFVPRFCYHPRMAPVGICRMCLVEVESPRGATLQPACFITVTDGMVAVTDSDKVKKAQDGVLEFLLANHPLDCPVCDKGGECPLQDQTLAHGSGETRYVEEKRHFAKPIPIGALVLLDRERCIQCARCTRFASEVAGDAGIDFAGRGDAIEVAPFPTEPFDSVFSGNTVQICPVGALTATPYRFTARPWDLEQVESSCTTCAVQCRVAVQSSGDRLTRVLGVDSDGVNHGWLCDKGRFAIEAVGACEGDPLDRACRLTSPLVRRDGALQPVSWDEALAAAAAVVREAIATSPDGLGAIGGAALTNEGVEAWRSLLVDALGVTSVDAQYGDGLDAVLLRDLPRATITEMATARVVVTLTGDLREELPVLLLRLRDGVTKHGVTVVEIGSIRSSAHGLATWHLAARPGEAHLVASALAGDVSAATALTTHAQGPATSATDIAAVRALLADGEGVVVVLGRANLAEDARVVETAAAHLAAAFPRATFLPALRRSNVMGTHDLGWFPRAGGRDTLAQLAALADGRQQAAVVLGGDLSSNTADTRAVAAALARGRFVVVSGHGSPDWAHAEVVLPATVTHERRGTVTNIEGRVTDVAPKVSAPGAAWDDVAIAGELADALGCPPTADSLELLAATVEARGYPARSVLERADRDGILSRRHDAVADRRAMDRMAFPGVLATSVTVQTAPTLPVSTAWREPTGPARTAAPEVPLADSYALRLVAARRLYDDGAAMAATPPLHGLRSPFGVRVHPYDLDRLGAATGDSLRVVTARGSFSAPVSASTDVTRGTVEVPLFAPDGAAAADLLAGAEGPVTEIRLESL